MSALGIRGRPHWTVERLQWLTGELQKIAHHDADGWYFSQEGLQDTLYARFHHLGYAYNGFVPPLRLLVHFGVLEPGKRGGKSVDSRRNFYPQMAQKITSRKIAEYHRAKRLRRKKA